MVRCFYRGDEELSLRQVIKPHNSSVNAIQFSPDGKYMATAGEDGLIFVLHTPAPANPTSPESDTPSDSDAYSPIGFIVSNPSNDPVTSLSWRSDSQALLFTSGTSTVEIDCSDPAKLAPIDVAKTFEMDLPRTTYAYKDRPKMNLDDSAPAPTDGSEEKKEGEEEVSDQRDRKKEKKKIARSCGAM